MGFRDYVKPGGRFEPEAGRYHLYVSYSCPFATGCLAVLHMKGLQDAIGVSVTHPTWQRTRPADPADTHTGWAFSRPEDPPLASPTGHGAFACDGCVPDEVNGAAFVRDLYDLAGDTTGKYSVPVLWDKKEKTIVNNESIEIIEMFNSAFNDVAKDPGLDLYPEDLSGPIAEAHAWVAPGIVLGVYGAGFAPSQAAYDAAFEAVFGALDRLDALLASQRYVAGARLTWLDVRLFQTLIRFDEAYFVAFKLNRRFLREYGHIREYVRDLYHTPGMAAAVHMQHIKVGYFTSKPEMNYHAIVPRGGEPWWEQPSSRGEEFAKGGERKRLRAGEGAEAADGADAA